MKRRIGLIFIIFTYLLKSIDGNQPITVHTNYGDILGYQTDKARVFYGIPFAEPPIGQLR
jgi:hypothetical protein